MNISQWPISRIMQLPDWCFGRRWVVSCTMHGALAGHTWEISTLAFPERIVLWEIDAFATGLPVPLRWYRVALGDQLPTTTAMMDVLEPFLANVGFRGGDPRAITLPTYAVFNMSKLRMPIETAGRRLILEVPDGFGASNSMGFSAVVSSIPLEVPDWLISANLRDP